MPRVSDLVAAMEAIAPLRLAASWDNVGLLVGDASASLSHVMLCIDGTKPVLAEARAAGCDALVAYHPILFEAQKRFLAGSPAYELARAGIAAYSPHTALDAAPGGTNDVLADALGMTDRAPLRPAEAAPELKLVVFVPAEHVAAVSEAVFAAGAGRIGRYASCSFRSAGTGTFFGEEGAAPVVGQAGRLEEVAELRLEVRVSSSRVAAVVRALRQSHPYEEPAFDLVPLAEPPGAGLGFGRIGAVVPGRASAHLERVKAALGIERVLAAGDLGKEVRRAGVAAGSGGDLVGDAARQGADLLLTGELRHHDALAAVRAGLVVFSVLHSVSERSALVGLERRLQQVLPDVRVSRSHADRDPFTIV
jgi:dinuclear metal center YbgI/SA1388 family protein